MPDKQIRSYLNHHLAGSVAALEALERLEAAEKDIAVVRTLKELHAEIAADRRVLEELMSRLQVTESETQKATAWLGEKISRVMFPLNEQKGGALHLLVTLEALSLGIEGKRALWQALSAVAQETAALQGPDYKLMADRAAGQRERVEKMRLDAARKALRPVG